ncbi:hypothetical protein MANES_10G076205v8 [Manihot esculenta]|uniref:Uncharacterized protein n=1 Tax=Manihot esculenta TaxID=3983 RepID=A0ACB7H0C9_MANES|nr:hypothetical protein MANES_10G076205v8 [Manihot esculenta]
MYYFLKSEGVDLWDIVENGPFFPTRFIDGNQEQKPKSEWSELEKRRVALNDKAIHILFCALSRSEYNKVCMKSIAKEIWDALVVTHEGTNQVKENKMESLIYQYELFKMKSDETISQMYDRFIEIIGGMKSLGKTFTNEELVKKILRCLPKEWLPKVTSLKDAKDLTKVQLDELLGNLIDYEMTLKREQVEEPSKMKKNIALRVASEDTSEEEEEISEEELALVTRRIRKLLLQNKRFIPRKNFRKEKGESSKKEVVICYECNKPGHYKVDCPKLKKPIKKFKKKAFKATWDESSDSEEEEVEESSDEVTTLDDFTLNDDDVEFSYDELVGALKLMNDELEKSHRKSKILKCELASFKKESENSLKEPLPSNDSLQKSLDELSLENKNLKNEILELKNSLSKFLKGKDKLYEILDSQRSPSIKYGLGYDKSTQANFSKTVFVKATNSHEPKVSSSNGNVPKVSSSDMSMRNAPTRNAHVHQSTSYNTHIRHTPRQFAYKRNDHYRTHTSSSQNHHSNHISCSHAFNKQRRNGHMRTQTHSLTYGPRVRLKSSKIESKWYLDSGCSRHMTGNSNHFISLEKKDGSGQVTFGDNGKGKIVGIGKVVLLVDGLKHNLLSPKSCFVSRMLDNKILFVGERVENIYLIDLQAMTNQDMKCFVSISDNSWIWHRRLSHASMDLLKNLSKDELVDGLPKIKYEKDKVCDACQMGKQVKSSFKAINKVISSRPLQLLHMDLFGPTRVAIDDYSRYTWVVFLAHKDDCFDAFKSFTKKVQNEKGFQISSIRSDHGREFENEKFETFCNKTPQQNDMGRTMLREYNLPTYFWAEAINTACYVSNRLWNGRKPRVSYFRVFGCKCFILNNKDNLGKFDSKTDEGIFLGYSISSKSYRVFNKRTLIVEESMHVVFDESNPFASRKEVSCDDDLVGGFNRGKGR